MNDKLKPCPFCGADEQRICRATMRADDLLIYSVECLDCGAEIADDESQDAADRHWNTRAAAALEPSGDVVERVARAICAASQGEWRTGVYLCNLDADELNNHWRHKAKAAIASLGASHAE